MIIYKITNTVNKKIYIGKTTKSIEKRFKDHFYNHKHTNTYLYKSMRKHGFDLFIIEKIEEVQEISILNEREKYWIKTLSPHYNMTEGGDGGDTSKSPNFIQKVLLNKQLGKYKGFLGKKGKDNPNFGKKRGKNPKISNALKNPCICDGVFFESIKDAEIFYFGICSVRKRLDNPKYIDWYRLVPKTKRK